LCGFEYSTELFEPQTIEGMAGQLERLLKGAMADPDESVSEIQILSPAEREELLVEWNRTEAEYGGKRTVVEMFEEQAARRPGELAVVGRGERISYGELNERANELGWYLREQGVGPEVKVGVCLERSVEMVVGIMGVMKAGGAYVAMDAGYPAERLRYMVKDAEMKLVLAGERVQREMREAGAEEGEGEEISYVDIRELNRVDEGDINKERERKNKERERKAKREKNLEREVEVGNLAYVIYTSGTTGEPKGVEISQGGLRNLVQWHCAAYGIGAGDRGGMVAETGFDASVWEMWPSLVSGGSLHIVEEEARGEPERLQRWLREEGITVTFLPTPMAEGILGLEEAVGGKLGVLLTGGDALRRRGREGERFRLVNHYGPTENTVVATAGEVEKERKEAGGAGAGTGGGLPGIGKPIGNVQVYVLDEWMEPVGVGVVGELYVGGLGLARGYVKQARLTAE
jgi:amino acid adenylation domain-containing protein